MGLKFKDIVERHEIRFRDLTGKVLAVDSFNMLYQFLTTIRGMDGASLTDSKGRVTSHLIGLFSRATSFMEKGLKLVFVFDGKAPALKEKTWEARRKVKEEAKAAMRVAEEEGDYAAMKKFSSRAVSLTPEMVEDAKKLLRALGLPIIEAPSEGEAQTAYMVARGDAWGSVSQDYDNLIFGCPRLIRNLSLEGRRRRVGQVGYQKIYPEMILLDEVLELRKLSRDQLVVLAILVGTDYNPGGVKGIGPKKGLKLVRECGDDFAEVFSRVEWEKVCPDVDWREIFTTIKEMKVRDDYSLEWNKIDFDEVRKLLVEEYEFESSRVESRLERLEKMQDSFSQKGLGEFF